MLAQSLVGVGLVAMACARVLFVAGGFQLAQWHEIVVAPTLHPIATAVPALAAIGILLIAAGSWIHASQVWRGQWRPDFGIFLMVAGTLGVIVSVPLLGMWLLTSAGACGVRVEFDRPIFIGGVLGLLLSPIVFLTGHRIASRGLVVESDDPRCRCGYLLRGLTSNACPECGAQFKR